MVQEDERNSPSKAIKGFRLIDTLRFGCDPQLSALENETKLPFENLKVIGIGEVAHASGGLHEVAGDIILKLAGTAPVNVLFESSDDAIEPVNLKITKGEDLNAGDLAALYQVWQTPQILEAFNRFSQLNRIKPGSISMAGIDVRLPLREFKMLKSLTQEGTAASTQFRIFDSRESLRNFEIELATGKGTPEHATLLRHLEGLLSRASVILANGGSDEQRFSLQKMKLWLNTYRQFSKDLNIGFNERDASMFEIAKQKIDKNHNQSVVWAHLGHLLYNSKNIKTPAEYLNKSTVLGSRLREHFGNSFQTVALLAKNIKLKDQEGKVHEFQTTPESIETMLAPLDGSVKLFKFKASDLKTNDFFSIGRTKENDPKGRRAFPEMKINDLQFDYALVINGSTL